MDLSFLDSLNEIAQTAFYIAASGVAIVGGFIATGKINTKQLMEAITDAVSKVSQLAADGHFGNLQEAVDEAILIVKDLSGKRRLSDKAIRNIERRVRIECDELSSKK